MSEVFDLSLSLVRLACPKSFINSSGMSEHPELGAGAGPGLREGVGEGPAGVVGWAWGQALALGLPWPLVAPSWFGFAPIHTQRRNDVGERPVYFRSLLSYTLSVQCFSQKGGLGAWSVKGSFHGRILLGQEIHYFLKPANNC